MARAFPFHVGNQYTRSDVYELLNVPPERRKGNWETGYHEWDGDFYIFCNVGAAGRSGHDYDNRWLEDGRFQWFTKEHTHVGQPQIKRMLNPTGSVLLFTRPDNRLPFTFEGYLTPENHEATKPVKILWKRSTHSSGNTQPIAEPSAVKPTDSFENDYAIGMRLAEVKQRIKQSVFRQRVLDNFGRRCCLSGVNESDLLVAGHILPWAAREESRLDPANGICLFVLYDALFDEGYFTLTDDLVVVTATSSSYSDALRQTLEGISGRTICSPKSPLNPTYLAFHREHVFRQ